VICRYLVYGIGYGLIIYCIKKKKILPILSYIIFFFQCITEVQILSLILILP
jgi:hypothetical protein